MSTVSGIPDVSTFINNRPRDVFSTRLGKRSGMGAVGKQDTKNLKFVQYRNKTNQGSKLYTNNTRIIHRRYQDLGFRWTVYFLFLETEVSHIQRPTPFIFYIFRYSFWVLLTSHITNDTYFICPIDSNVSPEEYLSSVKSTFEILTTIFARLLFHTPFLFIQQQRLSLYLSKDLPHPPTDESHSRCTLHYDSTCTSTSRTNVIKRREVTLRCTYVCTSFVPQITFNSKIFYYYLPLFHSPLYFLNRTSV